jgi:murein DD-endopeptidase MepM/ murein hydrolase activator NlpD
LITSEICAPISQTANDLNCIQFSKAIDSELKVAVDAFSEQSKRMDSQSDTVKQDFLTDMKQLQAAIQSLTQLHRSLAIQSLRELSRMRTESTEFLAEAITARKTVESRIYQLKIQSLELERIAFRQRESLETIEQQKNELIQHSQSFRKKHRPPGAIPGWQKFMTELEQLQGRLDDDWGAELTKGIELVDKELKQVIEQLKNDLLGCQIRVRPSQGCLEKRDEPINEKGSLSEMVMTKLTRMRKEREAAVSKTSSLVKKLLGNE